MKEGILALANGRDAEVIAKLKQANVEDPVAPKTFYIEGERCVVWRDGAVWCVTQYRDGTENTVQFRGPRPEKKRNSPPQNISPRT